MLSAHLGRRLAAINEKVPPIYCSHSLRSSFHRSFALRTFDLLKLHLQVYLINEDLIKFAEIQCPAFRGPLTPEEKNPRLANDNATSYPLRGIAADIEFTPVVVLVDESILINILFEYIHSPIQ